MTSKQTNHKKGKRVSVLDEIFNKPLKNPNECGRRPDKKPMKQPNPPVPEHTEEKVFNIDMSAMLLTHTFIKALIRSTKKSGYDQLTFTAEPILGPYLTINLKDFDEHGEEVKGSQ